MSKKNWNLNVGDLITIDLEPEPCYDCMVMAIDGSSDGTDCDYEVLAFGENSTFGVNDDEIIKVIARATPNKGTKNA